MSEYIKREDAIYLIKKRLICDNEHSKDEIAQIILEQAPVADVVEVVRCKDCKYKVVTKEGEYNPEDIVCDYWQSDGLTENDFCSQGKEQEHES